MFSHLWLCHREKLDVQFRDVMSDLQVSSGTMFQVTLILFVWVGKQCMVNGGVRGNLRIQIINKYAASTAYTFDTVSAHVYITMARLQCITQRFLRTGCLLMHMKCLFPWTLSHLK